MIVPHRPKPKKRYVTQDVPDAMKTPPETAAPVFGQTLKTREDEAVKRRRRLKQAALHKVLK